MAIYCIDCDYSYDSVPRADIGRSLRRSARALRDVVDALPERELRARPEPDVWSPLEYECHVRDVLEVQRERVVRALHEDEPEFTPMRRDERALELQYNAQDRALVGQQLEAAADALARTLEELDAAGWDRAGLYSYPTVELRSVEWIGVHTIHEMRHHRWDVEHRRTSGR